MKIKWFGHSCFLLTSADGARVLTDPFDEQVGYKVPDVTADIVTTSHDHYDHNCIRIVKGPFKHLRTSGSFTEKGIAIRGISTFHDEAGGSKRGRNIVFKFVIDGICVCHCGDLGHVPDAAQAAEIGKVDVLLVPVGGTYTLDYKAAVEVMQLLKPLITIPMHYKTKAARITIDGVDRFVSEAGKGRRSGMQEIELLKDRLEDAAKVVVMEYE